MKYVYMLSTYGENGSEECVVMMDRARIGEVMRERFGWAADKKGVSQKLHDLLVLSDEELSRGFGHDLTNGWGGVQLHVIPVYECRLYGG